MDHIHESQAELLPPRRRSVLLPRAPQHLLPARAGPDLRSLHHQRVRASSHGYFLQIGVYYYSTVFISGLYKSIFYLFLFKIVKIL